MMARRGEVPPHTELQNFGILMGILNCKILLYEQLSMDSALSNKGSGPWEDKERAEVNHRRQDTQ